MGKEGRRTRCQDRRADRSRGRNAHPSQAPARMLQGVDVSDPPEQRRVRDPIFSLPTVAITTPKTRCPRIRFISKEYHWGYLACTLFHFISFTFSYYFEGIMYTMQLSSCKLENIYY